MANYLKLFTFVFFSINTYGQAPYIVKNSSETIKLDGILDEETWKNANVMTGFKQYFPNDKNPAKYDTEVRMYTDDKHIYIAAKMISKGKKYIIPSYRRDFRAGGNDNITFCFDTFSDRTNAFMFGTNPYGVQREGLVFNGGLDNGFLNLYWDNKWKVATSIEDGAWYFEAAIPFSTLRFKDGSDSWYFKMYRFDTQANETTLNVAMPQSQIVMAIGYSDKIVFEKTLQKTRANISFIPYVSSRVAKDYEKVNPNDGFKAGIGFDAKVGISSGLNLDITVNPDFSNVEADRQIVNLTRFDVNLPEQRQFFLENSDLFTGFGSTLSNPFLPPTGTLAVGNQLYSPFFSRNIGIGKDAVTGLAVQNRINYGLRLSGKVNNTLRIGALNTQTANDESRGITGDNFSVLAVQKTIFQRSNIAAIFANKFSNKTNELGSRGVNSVAGLEYNLQSINNRWQGKAFYHRSFDETQLSNAFAHGVSLSYNTKKLIARWAHDWLGKGFNAAIGFVPRNNFIHINPTVGLNFFPKNTILNRVSVGYTFDQYISRGIGETDRKTGPFVLIAFQNTMRVLASVNQNYTYLFTDFDVLRSNRKLPLLPKETGYTYYTFESNLVTDLRKKIYLNINPIIGQYYDGRIIALSGNLNYRYQPYGLLAINYSYNDIKVSKGNNKVYVIGPSLDLTLSRKLFFTNLVQYNSQIQNFNINSRLQYRFAPVSDLFLVFTDNHNTETWMPKNKAIFLKLNYWFSL
jgi:Domain of unknown function (DUF5916)